MYGLPRKFNIAFDGGGAVASVEDTNDIGFIAVRVGEGAATPTASRRAGRLLPPAARRASPGTRTSPATPALLLAPDECVARRGGGASASSSSTATAPTARRRGSSTCSTDGASTGSSPRRKSTCRRAQAPAVAARAVRAAGPRVDRMAHVGFHPQKQPGLFYVGVVLPVGRMTATRCAGSPTIAERFGSGTIRLTVWQNLLDLRHPRGQDSSASKRAIEATGARLVGAPASAPGWSPAPATPAASSPPPTPSATRWRSPTTSTPRPRLDHADQHPPDRLPALLRPALHRRHRPARHEGRRRRRHGRGLPRRTSAAATGPSRGSAASSARRDGGGRGAAAGAAAPGLPGRRAGPDETFVEFTRRH